jgi:hypothetical protein
MAIAGAIAVVAFGVAGQGAQLLPGVPFGSSGR